MSFLCRQHPAIRFGRGSTEPPSRGYQHTAFRERPTLRLELLLPMALATIAAVRQEETKVASARERDILPAYTGNCEWKGACSVQ